MTFDWVIHLASFLVLVSYRGHGARYRRLISFVAFILGGLSLAAAAYAFLMPPNFLITLMGLLLFAGVVRCRGNVAKLFSRMKPDGPTTQRH